MSKGNYSRYTQKIELGALWSQDPALVLIALVSAIRVEMK